jgi:cytochrome oxidase Cu insertion factor (SCO1/SenC/PrrC family)
VYKDVKHPYFMDYVAYSVAETEMMGPPRKDETTFLHYIYAQYLHNRPVQYQHDRYMSFFNKFYADMFKMVSVSDEMDLFIAINKYASPEMVKRIFKKDVMLKDRRINELVLLRSLGQEYYNQEFDKEMILTMLDSIGGHSAFEEHRLMAQNIKRRLTYLNTGSNSPGYALYNQLDSLVTSDRFKGKFQYLMFWSVDNTVSVNEMKIMKILYEKYKWDVEFVSINVDDDPKQMKNFLRKNPYRWTFLHYGKDKDIRQRYNALTLPQFYLVDPDGVLIQAPALRPTPDGTSRSIEKTFYLIQKKRHPDIKIMPGQKGNGTWDNTPQNGSPNDRR